MELPREATHCRVEPVISTLFSAITTPIRNVSCVLVLVCVLLPSAMRCKPCRMRPRMVLSTSPRTPSPGQGLLDSALRGVSASQLLRLRSAAAECQEARKPLRMCATPGPCTAPCPHMGPLQCFFGRPHVASIPRNARRRSCPCRRF